MTENEWTLKGKKTLWEDMCTYVYSEGQINAARLAIIKYIELLSNMNKDRSSYKFVNPRWIICKINQIFGVEEDGDSNS